MLKNALYAANSKALKSVLNFIFVILLIEYVGKANFGLISEAQLIASYIVLLSGFGLEATLGRNIATEKYQNLVFTALIVRIFTSAILATITLACLPAEPIYGIILASSCFMTYSILDIFIVVKKLAQKIIIYSVCCHFFLFILKASVIGIEAGIELICAIIALEPLLIFLLLYYKVLHRKIPVGISKEYLREILSDAPKLLPGRLLFVIASTSLFLVAKGRLDPNDYGDLMFQFRVIAFTYMIFATITSSFDSVVFKRYGFIKQLRRMTYIFFIAIFLLSIITLIYGAVVDDYSLLIAFLGACPYIFQLVLNKWNIRTGRSGNIILQHVVTIGCAHSLFQLLEVSTPQEIWAVFCAGYLCSLIYGAFSAKHARLMIGRR